MLFKNEFEQFRQWAYARGLYESGDLKTQTIKLQEEAGEVARAVLNENREEIIDGIGDSIIVLVNLARLAEQHFRDNCETCRGAGGEFVKTVDESDVWIECKDCGVLDVETCLNKAFDEIKNRTGKMVNGTFIKDKKDEI